MRKAAYTLSLVFIALFARSTVSAIAETSPSVQASLGAEDLQADAAILRRAYEALHPGLYRYNTKAQMDGDFASLSASLNHDQSLESAYLAFSEFAAKIECGHTYANFFNQPDPVAKELFQGQNRVPFFFEWIDGNMVVTRDFTPDHAMPRGTRVSILNDAPTRDILARLMTLARADGANDAKRIAELGVRGSERYEAFDVFYSMLFPLASPKLRIVIRPPGAINWHGIDEQALTFAQRTAAFDARDKAGGEHGGVAFEWRYLRDGAAYLRMPTWALYDSKWDWKSWLSAHLDALVQRNPPALVIDLRGNEGGLDVGDAILARLVTHDVQASVMKPLVRYRAVPADLLPYLSTWDASFKNWGASAVDLAAPWPTAPPATYFALERPGDADSGVIRAGTTHYGGRVFVLVDANNSSATFRFAQIIQQNKLGTLVGQPTGGNQRGINGGAFFFLHLPNSKIEMDLPLIGTFAPAQQPNAGLTPDIVVTPTADDIAAGRDPGLSAIEGRLVRVGLQRIPEN